MSKTPVILDHDGGHDDLVALCLLLANADKVKVIGCVITDADCFVQHGFNVTGKIMAMMHKTEGTDLFPIGKTSFKGVNPFPSDWRWSAKNMEDLPCVNIPEHNAVWEEVYEENDQRLGEQLMADLVLGSPEKVTLCVTGPLSCVAWCIDKYGDAFVNKIEKCVIMGGALHTKGNVFIEGRTDGSAEWNIFWDPAAAKKVLENTKLKKVLFSLDSTNHVPVNSSVVRRFGAQNEYLLSQFIGSAWASCTHHELMRPGDGYYAWDVLTAAYVVDNSISTFVSSSVEVVLSGESEGKTEPSFNGDRDDLLVGEKIDVQKFYDLVLQSARKARM
uniref:Purine nucleosidase n=1 Tax=Angomonas desouzai TaxID=59800 RepID=T1YRX0_9TRYP|nr:purine nucleosidase [Angomonas desouzai]